MILNLFVPIKLNSERLQNKMLLPLGDKLLKITFIYIYEIIVYEIMKMEIGFVILLNQLYYHLYIIYFYDSLLNY